MSGYTKLFQSILDSTIWQESSETRLLWITMLAMSDKNGEVQASIPGLAKRAGITLKECENGLETLLSPDPYSRTPDFEGRRIEVIDGGWSLLNHAKYRELMSYEERKEYNRRKQAEHRAKKAQELPESVNDMSITVNHSQSQSAMSAHNKRQKAKADTKEDEEGATRSSSSGLTDSEKLSGEGRFLEALSVRIDLDAESIQSIAESMKLPDGCFDAYLRNRAAEDWRTKGRTPIGHSNWHADLQRFAASWIQNIKADEPASKKTPAPNGWESVAIELFGTAPDDYDQLTYEQKHALKMEMRERKVA